MSRYNSTPRKKQRGFTIVEFMIATAVFSVILLGVTATILRLSRNYQHSIYSSKTQAATNNLIDTVTQSIKYSSSGYTVSANGDTQTRCFGTRQFLFAPGRQLGSTNPATGTRHAVLTRVNADSSCPADPIVTSTPSGPATELLGTGMRIAKLDISGPVSGLYTVTVKVVYGDDDLLCSPSVAGSCESSNLMTNAQLMNPDIRCKSVRGSEFCKVSELSSTVYKRL